MRLRWNEEDVDLATRPIVEQLTAMKVRAGHRIGVLAGNTPLHLMLHLAARQEGWTLVPFSNETVGRGAGRLIASRCDLIVSSMANEGLAAARANLPILVCHAMGKPRRSHLRRINPPPEGPAPAFILHTSGTTGEPHPVAITHDMLEAHAKAASSRLLDAKDSVWLGVLGLHRIGGVALARRVQQNGSTLILEEHFDAERVAMLLRKDEVTHVSLVPTMLTRLIEVWGEAPPPASLRCVLLGGDRAPEELVRPALQRGWPIWCTYGMSESCSQAATATPQQRLDRPGTSGRPLDGVGFLFRDGEIVLSGPTIMGGGPLATGDLGHLDGDGFLFVTGRKGDRITTGGVKVEPGPVEDALRQHPAIADACVVGLPDAEWGERVAAAIVLRAGQTMPDLRAWCKAHLAPEQVPKSFHAVAGLPRTEAGKLRRSEVRASLQATVPT